MSQRDHVDTTCCVKPSRQWVMVNHGSLGQRTRKTIMGGMWAISGVIDGHP